MPLRIPVDIMTIPVVVVFVVFESYAAVSLEGIIRPSVCEPWNEVTASQYVIGVDETERLFSWAGPAQWKEPTWLDRWRVDFEPPHIADVELLPLRRDDRSVAEECVNVQNSHCSRVVEGMGGTIRGDHHDVWMRVRVYTVLISPHVVCVVVDAHRLVCV